MEKILESTKKMLGIVPEDTSFDDVLIMYINSALQVMSQLGVNVLSYVSTENDTYTQIFGQNYDESLAKPYITAKVRMIFDPPQSSVASEALKAFISECEWRMNAAVDPVVDNAL